MPKRITNALLQADQDALSALEAMPDYNLRIARYRAAQAEVAFHEILVGVKEQVRAQYGQRPQRGGDGGAEEAQ